MANAYRVVVFGKQGCDKCGVLNQRLDKLLAGEEWQDFEKLYCDVETEEGMVAFCEAECLNPQRIPALMVLRYSQETQTYEAVANPRPGEQDPVCKGSRLYQVMGLQTDYSEAGGGIISPKMIATVLTEARA